MQTELAQVLTDPDFQRLEDEATASGGAGAAASSSSAAGSSGRAAGGGPTVPEHEGSRQPDWVDSAWFAADTLESREDQADGEEMQAEMMAELNDDLEALDDEVEGYIIRDAAQVSSSPPPRPSSPTGPVDLAALVDSSPSPFQLTQPSSPHHHLSLYSALDHCDAQVDLKRKVWEQMNKEYLDAQADKEAARAEAGSDAGSERGKTRPSLSKRQRKDANDAKAAGSVAEAVAGELRRNKLSSRINYEVVQILSQTLDDDAEHMPDEPGPINPVMFGAQSPRSSHDGGYSHAASGPRDWSENLSVHSSYGGDDGEYGEY